MTSQIKEQVETIKKEKENVIQLEKTRTEFFNNVTHELKTPLTVISGYAQILEVDDFDDREFLKRAATNIKNESDRLQKLVVNLIEISKKSTYIKNTLQEVLNLKEIISPIAESMQLKANKYNITIEGNGENVFAKANLDEMKEVFINVLDNAIKYGKSCTKINWNVQEKEKFCVFTLTNCSEEIESRQLEKLFEPFYRVKRMTSSEKGSNGLGLYICKNIVEEHSGTIKLENKNKITKVTIKIPLWKQDGNN